MPRPNKPRTVGAEDRVREHIRRFLAENERGSAWFARKMQEHGCDRFTPMTLTKILDYGRRIYVDETIAMAAIMGVTLDDLAREP